MSLFKRDKTVDSSVNSEVISPIPDSIPVAQNYTPPASSGNGVSASVLATIDRLNAESIANKEVRAAVNDRFAKISESIGELRTMLRNNEKTISIMEAKVEKSVGLIDAVQPQNLLSTVNKVDFKVEALKAKIEANELIYNKIRDDIRDLRNKFVVFRNIELVKELNEDSKKRFRDLQRIELEIVKRSDRTESMFNEVEKTIKDSKENTKSVYDMSESIKKLLLSNDKLKSDLALKVSRQEYSKIQESMDKSKEEIIGIVVKDLEDYKRRTIKDIEVNLKQNEVRLVHDLVKEDMKKSGINLDSLNNNDRILKILMFMNMELLAKDFRIERSKLDSFKDNPYAFMVVAYAAMKLRNSDVPSLKKELLQIGFEDKNCDQILSNAKLLGKMF